jgi:drug/metabolite transporter (DMT)-like permease
MFDMKSPPPRSNLLLTLLLFVSYLTLNITLNILNKWILTYYGFSFPLLLTMAHMLFMALALLPLMLTRRFRELHAPALKKQWLSLLMVATFFALNIGLNNASLLSLSLSLNQVIRSAHRWQPCTSHISPSDPTLRSAVPVVTALVSIGIENRKVTRKELISLVLLAAGVGISVYEATGTANTFQGIALCFFGTSTRPLPQPLVKSMAPSDPGAVPAATLCHALTMASAGKMLTEKMDVVRLSFYTAPLSCFVVSPFYMQMESDRFQAYFKEHSNSFVGAHSTSQHGTARHITAQHGSCTQPPRLIPPPAARSIHQRRASPPLHPTASIMFPNLNARARDPSPSPSP